MEEVRCGTGAGGPCAEATEVEESVERRREKVERAGGGGGELARLEKEDIITGCYALAQPLSRLDSEVLEYPGPASTGELTELAGVWRSTTGAWQPGPPRCCPLL